MYGNDNLAAVGKSQFLTVDASTDFITMSGNVQGLHFYTTTDVWISYGTGTVVAAKPGAEKTAVDSFFLPANGEKDIGISASSDENPLKVAALQDSTGGTLHVQEWKLS